MGMIWEEGEGGRGEVSTGGGELAGGVVSGGWWAVGVGGREGIGGNMFPTCRKRVFPQRGEFVLTQSRRCHV